jgi:putative transposase
VYYTPRPLSERDLRLMRRIDELHLELPYYGTRKLAAQLRREGHEVGRRHVRTLMRRMGIEALYRRPRTASRRGERRSTRICCRGLRSSARTRCGRLI